MNSIIEKDKIKYNNSPEFDYIFANSAMLDLIDDSKNFKPCSTSYSDHKYLYIDTIEH